MVNHGSPKAEPGVRFPPLLPKLPDQKNEKIFSVFSPDIVHCGAGSLGLWFLECKEYPDLGGGC